MKVRNIVQHKAKVCYGDTSLAEAAAMMLEHNYGILPVVESMTGKLCGVITDRDICMGALTQSLPLERIPVRHCCSREIYSAKMDDDIEVVHDLMSKHRIRRVPIIAEDDRVIGLVSIDDLAIHACIVDKKSERKALTKTLAAVCDTATAGASKESSAEL